MGRLLSIGVCGYLCMFGLRGKGGTRRSVQKQMDKGRKLGQGRAMPHDHASHDDPHALLPSDPALRVKALETLLTKKGLIDPAALDEIIDTYENKIGPRNGARVVARAWSNPAFHDALMKDATSVVADLGFYGRQGEHMVAVENTDTVHNMVVCTLCSCYPWPLLGIPPGWYKSDAYRARVVREPRQVLAEFGVVLPDDTAVRVWDSTAEMRYLVIPQRPAGTEGMDEEALMALVSRDSMIGTGLAGQP
ncbi:nitrile hydratase [Sulfitobacter geojensis]|nr:nitrile hydratase [Sulfitobacter geojensis]